MRKSLCDGDLHSRAARFIFTRAFTTHQHASHITLKTKTEQLAPSTKKLGSLMSENVKV